MSSLIRLSNLNQIFKMSTADLKQTLASQISGTVLVPNDKDYNESIKRWAENSQKKAAYVVLVKNEEDISKTIVWATAHKLDLAIKGGGHSCSGASSTEGGVVVDLSHLRNVRVDPEKRLAYVEGGALWADFNAATMAHNLASPGGVISHTGVGGLVVGGGQGYLTGQHGLCIDNLEEATVVTASGEIVKASEKENPDLFWGIRGGGSNFGVVYEFVIRLHPHPGNCFGGFMAFTVDKIPGIVAACKKLEPFRPDMSLFIGAAAPEKTTLAIVAPFLDTTDLAVAKEFYADLYELEPVMDMTGIHSYLEQNSFMDPMMPHGPRTYMTGYDYQTVTVDIYEFTVKKYDEYMEKCGDDFQGGAILFESYPFQKINEIPYGGTAYANRGEHFNCTIGLRWSSEQHDEWIKAWIKDFVRDAREVDRKAMIKEGKGATDENSYINFHLPGDPVEKAFGNNLSRLIELKRKWDPNGRFNKWFNIPT